MRLNPRATRSSAVSQSLSTKLPSPRRSIGWVSRPASPSVSLSAEPLEHRRPKFAGCDGSPEISAPPRPSGRASTPQPTPQYGHVVRTAGVSGGSAFMRLAPRGARPCGLLHLARLGGRGGLAGVAPAERSKSGEGALPRAQGTNWVDPRQIGPGGLSTGQRASEGGPADAIFGDLSDGRAHSDDG